MRREQGLLDRLVGVGAAAQHRHAQPAEDGAAGSEVPAPDETSPTQEEDVPPDTALAAERLEEMRRMQAEFVNFRNRTQREREGDRDRAVAAVVEAMLPVMDDIHSAREHGDLAAARAAAETGVPLVGSTLMQHPLEDVAAAILYFASEEASFVSGQVLYVAGGPRT